MHASGFCPTCKPLQPFVKRVHLLSSLEHCRTRPATRCTLTSSSPPTPSSEMSSYLPSLKWPSFGSQNWTAVPAEDAPLYALPPSERAALDALTELTLPIVSEPPAALPQCDPWNALLEDEDLRNRVLVRLLRFNGLSASRAARQLHSILAWRAKSRIAEQPCEIMYGMEAGLPISLLTPVGEGGARLFFAPAERYVKKEANHSVQEVSVARMLEYMLYDVGGPKAERCNVVVDFTGFSSRNIDLVGMKSGVSTYMNYYPDIFHKILLINYPKFLYGVWRVICPLLDERTANRVIWLSNGEALRKELEVTFSKAQIPDWLGGAGGSKDGTIKLLNGMEVEPSAIADRFS